MKQLLGHVNQSARGRMAASVKGVSAKILKFGISVGLIYWMVNKGLLDFSVLGQLLTPLHVSMGLGFIFLNLALNNYRWSILLQSQNLPGRFKVSFPLTLIGMFFNFAIPGAVGGDLVKGYYVAQDHPGRRVAAATTVIMDRILGLYSMVLLAVLTILFNIGFVSSRLVLMQIAAMAMGVLLAMTFVLGLMFSSRVKAKNPILQYSDKIPGGTFLVKLYTAVHSYGESRAALVKAIIVSLIAQAIAVVGMAYVGWAIGEQVSLATYFFAVPLGFIIMAIPIAPGGIGVGQLAFLALFKMYTGTDTILGQTVITAFQIGLLVWGLVGAVLYASRKKPILNEVGL